MDLGAVGLEDPMGGIIRLVNNGNDVANQSIHISNELNELLSYHLRQTLHILHGPDFLSSKL